MNNLTFFSLLICQTLFINIIYAVDEESDPAHSYIDLQDTTQAEVPVHPGLLYTKHISYFKGKSLVGIRLFYNNGVLLNESVYRDGVANGICRSWYANGVIHSINKYDHGFINGEVRQWSQGGKLIGSYQMNMGTGNEIDWRDNGSIERIASYIDGHLWGTVLDYYDDGSIKEIHTYKNDFQDGPIREYSRTHALLFFGMYQQSALVGPYISWDENGKYIDGTPKWYLDNHEVSLLEYEAARAKNPSLPKSDAVDDIQGNK